MIKVIKHGHAQYVMTCEKCECVFTYEDEDIESNNCQFDYCQWITCPECKFRNEKNLKQKYLTSN